MPKSQNVKLRHWFSSTKEQPTPILNNIQGQIPIRTAVHFVYNRYYSNNNQLLRLCFVYKKTKTFAQAVFILIL